MWHNLGKVNVTKGSDVVTGVGTKWVENVRVGDAFQGPDGKLYQVINVASDEALAISPAYEGSTAKNLDYWIVPIPGFSKTQADRLALIINRLDGDIAKAFEEFLRKDSNLADVEDKKVARDNLGITAAFDEFNSELLGINEELGTVLRKDSNLADVKDKKTARDNLGLGTAATRDVGEASGNLMPVGAFGLSDGAAKTRGDVDEVFGDIFSTVAAATNNKVGGRYGILLSKAGWQDNSGVQVFINYSDSNDYIGFRRYREGEWKDWREIHHSGNLRQSTGSSTEYPMSQKAVTDALSAKANTTTQIIAGNGLTGGGSLAANRTLTLGTPSTITKTATNSVSPTSHTHELGADVKASLALADGALQKNANLNDLTNKTTARSNLGLGSAATRDVVSSNTDAEGGSKLVTQGWMGLGSQSPQSSSDLDEDYHTGFTRNISVTANSPTGYGTVLVLGYGGEDRFQQLVVSNSINEVYWRRVRDGISSDWFAFHHTGNFPPIGFCYTQYPDTPTPSELFGGTWTLMFNTEGVFFRTEGQGASSFGGGVQGDAQQPVTGNLSFRQLGDAGHNTVNSVSGPFYFGGTSGAAAATASGEVVKTTQVINFDSSRAVRTASENRPRNRTVRIWRKTAH